MAAQSDRQQNYLRVISRLEAGGCLRLVRLPDDPTRNVTVRCPAHNDNEPSMTFCMGDDGRVLVKCQRGCEFDQIVAALDLTHEDFDAPPIIYQYTDRNGVPLYEKVRKPGKKFKQRRPDPKRPGEYISGLDGVKPTLYNLVGIQDQKEIAFVEGEKDVETLRRLGRPATTSGGATS